jgi:hypothetical protein
VTAPLIGYGSPYATEAHLVRSIPLRQALCGVTLPSIPLHQMRPERTCWACQALAPTMPPLLVSALHDGDDTATGVCPGCGDPQSLDEKGRIQPHDVQRVKSGVGPCDGAGQQPEVTR